MSLRTDDPRTDPQPRADARPSIAEMHERATAALHARWREPSDMPRTAAQPPLRDTPRDEGVRDEAHESTRIDVGAVPKVADLYERHRQGRLREWRESRGDDPRAKVPGGAR
jgi:hypothetical protein